jgi:hypothetical protein
VVQFRALSFQPQRHRAHKGRNLASSLVLVGVLVVVLVLVLDSLSLDLNTKKAEDDDENEDEHERHVHWAARHFMLGDLCASVAKSNLYHYPPKSALAFSKTLAILLGSRPRKPGSHSSLSR